MGRMQTQLLKDPRMSNSALKDGSEGRERSSVCLEGLQLWHLAKGKRT